jgi:hypothetical protein
LVGLVQPLVPVFDQKFILELYKLLCKGPNYPDHWAMDIIHLHHPLEGWIRKNR